MELNEALDEMGCHDISALYLGQNEDRHHYETPGGRPERTQIHIKNQLTTER